MADRTGMVTVIVVEEALITGWKDQAYSCSAQLIPIPSQWNQGRKSAQMQICRDWKHWVRLLKLCMYVCMYVCVCVCVIMSYRCPYSLHCVRSREAALHLSWACHMTPSGTQPTVSMIHTHIYTHTHTHTQVLKDAYTLIHTHTT